MNSPNKGAYGAMLVLSGLFTAAALLTLVPNPRASWENVLGYRSLCTFAPIATSICAFLAGTCCVIRSRLLGPRAGIKRSWIPPLAAGLLLVIVIAASIPAYVAAKTDAGSGATVTTEG